MDTVLANTASPSYELSADQLEIRDQARKYFMSEFHPLQERMDNEDWWPQHMFKTLGGMGYLGQTVSEEYGGAGLDYLTSGVIAEAMTYANPGVAFSWLAHDNLCLNNIFRSGNDDQRRRYIPKMCSGALIGALGMTEPGAGSDALGSMRTRARREGD
ncbi:MAG: acyl-CoA dehydrogenase family protein, partial [Rhodospirillales bacterium]|nr:acyl-CoA dehydrogenase family protein [Rhodospirillales bacterium]